MRYINCILLFLLFCSYAFTQTKDLGKSILECTYNLVMYKDTVSKSNPIEDDMVLRIGETASQFFSCHTFYHDSLWADPYGRKKAEELSIESLMSPNPSLIFGARTTKDFIYKNYPNGKLTIYAKDFNRVNFYYSEDYTPQNWYIEDSTKLILGYKCKKAESDFRGRSWIAWYAMDIPVKDGPWKLNGLPGLILEAYDSKMDYHYTATSINKKPVQTIALYKFDDNEEMETDRITYNSTLEKYLMGADLGELVLLQEALDKGIELRFSRRRSRKLRYDLLERDHLNR